VTVGQFARYVEITGLPFESPQIRRVAGACLMRQPTEPVAFVSYDQAMAYAHWLAGRLGQPVDLPTEQEWEYMARAGVPGGPFPWGWGDPAVHANFRSAGPLPVGCFPANRFGLRDLAGNVAEWCRAEPPDAGQASARGGSWADRRPDLLHVDRRVLFPREYRDADVGFRLVIRAP
jgi:formylglycine-generating enzyme required for sulfatase activity